MEEAVRSYLEQADSIGCGTIFFSPGQVQKAIQTSKPRKAPGMDGITNSMLKHLPGRATAAITRLFNGILRSGHFPTAWKTGRIIMIPKQGKNILLPESYRPITLLSSLSKLFEKLLLGHLIPHITPRSEQYGFRSEHSTTLQLSRVLHHLTVAFNKKEHAVAVFLDMEKAFDKVWHQGLLFKLSTSPTPSQVVRVIASFLADRSFRVSVEGFESSQRPIRAGVPQGSCLSPVCYSRYTDDIPTTDEALLALYADDAAYVTSSYHVQYAATKMQRVLDLLPPWLSKWRLSVNVAKTQAVVITRKTKLPAHLSLQGQEILWARSAKYLGVTIDRKLSMERHVKGVRASTIAARMQLRPVLQSELPLRLKLGLYKTYIRPRLTYAAPAWYGLLAERLKEKLRSQQNQSLRSVVKAQRYVRNATIQRDLAIEDLDSFIGRLATQMFDRTEMATFPHLQELAPTYERTPGSKAYPRELALDSSQQPDRDHPDPPIATNSAHHVDSRPTPPAQGDNRPRSAVAPRLPGANPTTLQ